VTTVLEGQIAELQHGAGSRRAIRLIEFEQ